MGSNMSGFMPQPLAEVLNSDGLFIFDEFQIIGAALRVKKTGGHFHTIASN